MPKASLNASHFSSLIPVLSEAEVLMTVHRPKIVSVKTAIESLLKTPKYNDIGLLQATLLYYKIRKETKTLKEDEELVELTKLTSFEQSIFKKLNKKYGDLYQDYLTLKDKAFELVEAIKGRLESLKNQKHNYSLFEGLAGYIQTEILETENLHSNFDKEHIVKMIKQLYKGFSGKSILNLEKNIEIKFARVGMNETLWHNRNKLTSRFLMAIENLPTLIHYAKFIKESNPKPTHVKKYKAIKILTFESKIKISGRTDYYVITVFETNNKIFKYFIEESTIKKSVRTRYGTRKAHSILPNGQNKSTTKKPKNQTGLSAPTLPPVVLQDFDTAPVIVPVHAEPVPTPIETPAETPINNDAPGSTPEIKEVGQAKKTVTEAPLKPVKKSKGVLNSQQIMGMQFDALQFTGDWANLMQSPAKNMRIAIWGKPKNGKTVGAAQLANYLTHFGNILYVFADQGFNKSTQDIWKLSGLANNPKAYATDTRSLDELEKLVKSNQYQFVFIDMINTFINQTGIKYYEFEERFLKAYPNTSFVLVFEVTKAGDFKGDQGWTHLPDALITVEDFVMENKGRYGMGEYVIWKEGLKRFNPKRYAALYPEETEKPMLETVIL